METNGNREAGNLAVSIVSKKHTRNGMPKKWKRSYYETALYKESENSSL